MTSSRAADATDPLESRAEKNGWKGRILVVDDETGICRVLQGFLGREGHEVVTEQSATAARARIREAKPAFNLALIDVNLDGESGLDLVNDLERMDEAMVKIVMTGQATMENAIASLRAGAYDFIEKPFNLDHLSSSVQRALEYHALIKENRNYQHQLESMVRARNRELSTALTQLKESHAFTLNALSALLDAKEAATGEHSYRVSKMSRLLAQRMGLPQKLVDEIEHGGLLHDIGKVGVPDAILLKPGQLTEEEWTVMRQHPEIGYRILARRPHLAEIAQIVYQHQERYDGSGYPLGLKGEEICLGARIFAIVDTYDAIRSERPYSPSRPADVAVKVIQEGSGLFFDPKVVEVFETCWNEFEEIGKWSNPPAGCGTTP
ncbi:MAG TPA: HD domain-containing phosphohydrolase [Kiritimatiellia bacterium]|nr:HD domain-containing phosphohydrolase [Kiritimatiellia bacterium]